MADPIREDISVDSERAVLAAVMLPGYEVDLRDPLGELRSLADTAGAECVGELIQNRTKPAAGTFMGRGKVEELAQLVKELEAQVVIFENDLSPAQLRSIEEMVEVKILDRSELILDIFANRARTYEAKLQVELAQLQYTYPRLRAMWSHLERIAGGAPAGIGTRGPGEQQLEIDRRLVQKRKAELSREIQTVQSRKQREVDQRNVDFYTVGLVGYTNAGKSTLFNTLTDAGVYADDKLFATLDTRTRRWDLGDADAVMLSDTVGFVRNLPHHLVASFKATLEESIYSNLLLIVLDVSDPRAEHHMHTVNETLKSIGVPEDKPRVLLLNKIDQIENEADLVMWKHDYPDAICISARQGLGLNEVVERVRSYQRGGVLRASLRLPLSDGKSLHFLENRAEVKDREYEVQTVVMDVVIGQRQLDQLRSTCPQLEVLTQEVEA